LPHACVLDVLANFGDLKQFPTYSQLGWELGLSVLRTLVSGQRFITRRDRIAGDLRKPSNAGLRLATALVSSSGRLCQ